MSKVGTSKRLARALMAVASGNIISTERGPFRGLDAYRHQIYHRIDLTTTDSQVEFFNVQPEQHICNMPAGANGLPNNYGFVCTKVLASFEYGYTTTGSAVAAVEGYNTSSAPLLVANDIRHLLDKGLFRLEFSNDHVLEVFGLKHLSAGGGMQVDAVTNSATTASFANVQNGTPHDDNGFALSPWKILWPGESARGRLDYNFNRTLTGGLVLNITLDGIVVRD